MTRHFLVIRFGSLGDVILTSAPLLNLKASFPGSRISLLTKQRFTELAGMLSGVDEVIPFDDAGSARAFYDLLIRLDSNQYTDIVDLHGNLRSWLACRLISASRKASYPKRRLERLRIVRTHRYPALWPHTIDLYNQAVVQIGGHAVCQRPVLPASATASFLAGEPAIPLPYVVVSPGAAHPNKQWPMDRFAEVARQLHDRHGLAVLWVTTAAEAGRSGLEASLPRGAYIELVDQQLPRLAAIFSGARLALANDSGLMHLASAVGVPVIGLFGSTHPSLGFAPRGQFDQVIEVDEPCRPCSLHGRKPCYRDERYCFTRISIEQVVSAAETMLAARHNACRALFVDRDGTLTVEKYYSSDPSRLELVPGAAQALASMKQRGFRLVVVTNQSGVARGYFSQDDVHRMNDRLVELLRAEGVELDAVYYCPHHRSGTVPEFATTCTCRKPYPGMAEQAARELGVDLRRSIVIGDKQDDLQLGRVIGATSILVRTGYGRKTEAQLNTCAGASQPIVADDLPAAVQYVKDHGL